MSSFAGRIRAAGLCLGLALPAATLAATPDLAPEDLLFGEVPVVISATRTERSRLDVPNSTTVITGEQIRECGATTIEEVLQMVPGLEIMRISNSDINMSARGFNVENGSNLLVMIDGRSAYRDFFGIVGWESLNVALEDIDRIEVIRGPGSALYGANAFLGTVNIVTRRARELPRAHASAGFGPESQLFSLTGSAAGERAAIKGSASYRHQDYFRNETDTASNVRRGRDETDYRTKLLRTTFEYDLAGGGRFRLSGGTVDTAAQLLTAVGTFGFEGPEYYAQADLALGPWQLQSYFTRIDFGLTGVPIGLPGTPLPIRDRLTSNTFDLELQREVTLGSHALLVGASGRLIATDAPAVLGSREADALWGLFVHDEFRINDRFTAFLGARADHHPQSGLHLSPRLGLVVRLGESERLRFSFARAYRIANQIQNYSSLDLQSDLGVPTTVVRVMGNEELDPIFVDSFDLGYETTLHPRLKARVDLFFNILQDFQQFSALVAGPPTVMGFRNAGRTRSYGGELTLEFRAYDWLRGFASYSFQSSVGPDTGAMPRHKASAGLRGQLTPQLRYALTGTVVGHTEYETTGRAFPDDEIRSHAALDAYVGFRLTPEFELGLKGRNLLHQVRRQHPLGDEIGSQVLLLGTLEF